MSTQQNNVVKLPVDLTPAQRAGLKLISHFAIIAIFNGVMAGLVVASNGQVFNWQTVGMVVLGQAVLALLDALKKYYTASNQLPLSTLFDLVRQETLAKIQPISYTPIQQAISDNVNSLLNQTDASPNAAQNAAKPAVLSASPSDLKPDNAPAPTQVAPTAQYTLPDNVQTVNTLPNLSAVPKQPS